MNEIEAIAARHIRAPALIERKPDCCDWCLVQWPCDAAVLLAALRAAEQELADMGDRLHGAGFEDAILLAEAVKPFEARADAAEVREARLREAAQALVDSAVLVPMEREDDDDGPAEFWCVHPDPLAECRAALASTEEPRHE